MPCRNAAPHFARFEGVARCVVGLALKNADRRLLAAGSRVKRTLFQDHCRDFATMAATAPMAGEAARMK